MTRTSPEPGPTPASHLKPRRSSPLRRRGIVTACAIGASLLLLPVSAHADPDLSERELRAKVERLQEKAEILTEKYNGQRLELKKAKKAARQAEEHAEDVARRLDKVRDAIGALAADRYKSGGGLRQGIAFLGAENPEDLVKRATMLAHISRQKAAKLQYLQAKVQEAEQAEKQAEKAAAKVKSITEDIQQKQEHIEELVSKVEDKLAEIEAEEQARASRDYNRAPIDVDVVGSGTAAQAAEVALAQQGEPYVWGAAGPDAFDCSGLVVYAYAQVGISLPHYTGALINAGPQISRGQLRPGDLVFTSSHHVGIYVGNGKMVNAPNSGTVVQVESIEGESLYAAVRITS